MKTHDVEQLLGITKQALIYYEKEGLIKPTRNKNNYREYNQNDIELLQLILTLRSMGISIDDIKLILSGDLSIRYCLKNKQEYFQQEKKKIEIIENKITDYIKRTKVTIVNPKKDAEDNGYIGLYYLDDQIKFDQNIIAVKDIKSINISLCCSKGEDGRYYGIYNLYFVYLDINTNYDTYSLQLMNNSEVSNLFSYLSSLDISIDDSLNLMDIYFKTKDPMELYKILNRNFRKWQKEYNLEIKDSYWSIVQNTYIKPLQNLDSTNIPTFKEQLKLVANGYINIVKNGFKK
ncbi:hypothetical protein B5E92_09425 [Erysipelatoclostridium sp. An15]|uniref:MerR family transcriptional regulator n=2 Tax=Thomasclavelia TaxID=3025755 RepID=UPI000B392DD0|nr:MerR family transcriptional regulator [Erysipelatoclostridium sp. An15]OUQ07088.1 hypothetical protein B5E92_09425 [Erysipelatoclostridium sp. An15]